MVPGANPSSSLWRKFPPLLLSTDKFPIPSCQVMFKMPSVSWSHLPARHIFVINTLKADFGILLPRLSLLATIALVYSVLSPLINLLALISESFILLLRQIHGLNSRYRLWDVLPCLEISWDRLLACNGPIVIYLSSFNPGVRSAGWGRNRRNVFPHGHQQLV